MGNISVNEDGVRIINDGMVGDYNFGAAIGIALNGTMVNFKPDHRNENVFITILSDRGTTELLAMEKHDKNTMKFSIINSEGLSGNLGGIVGQNLIPHEYHVDNTGIDEVEDDAEQDDGAQEGEGGGGGAGVEVEEPSFSL